VVSYLKLRDRLSLSTTVCKTFNLWLRGQPVLYGDMHINLGKHCSDSEWLKGNGLVRLFSGAPPGSIHGR
jgi:hypothetical protein